MDTTKIIKGVVNSGRYTVTAPIVKEDYGLYLQIEGVELPSTYEVDLVTFECGLNDWGNITLGEIGDKSNDSFIGNFTQCIEYHGRYIWSKLKDVLPLPKFPNNL